jgi:RNA polymerase sigma-70 factor (ECF subfamily)
MVKASADLPDEVLVVAAILGDLAAFNELVLRYRAAVVRLAQTIVGREDAEDVAQEVFLLAFKALPAIENPTKFAAWVMTITRHRALRFSKQKRRRYFAPIEFDESCLNV